MSKAKQSVKHARATLDRFRGQRVYVFRQCSAHDWPVVVAGYVGRK